MVLGDFFMTGIRFDHNQFYHQNAQIKRHGDVITHFNVNYTWICVLLRGDHKPRNQCENIVTLATINQASQTKTRINLSQPL